MNGETWARVVSTPRPDDCFWTLMSYRPDQRKKWQRIRMPTFLIPDTMRRGDMVRVRYEGTPGYGAWRPLECKLRVRNWRRP